MSECPYCTNSFEMTETCHDEFRMWQGLVGPYYIPTVDEEGVLSWTNTGGLPNPDAVDISGPPGKGLNIKGVVTTVGDLPANPEEGDTYLVGATDPYDGYIWLNGTWIELGDISKGDPGEGVPTGGTTGQVLAKASNTDYDTEWVNQSAGVDPATANPLMDGTAAVGTSTKYAREDHVHPVDTSRASASDVSSLTEEVGTFVRPNLLDNWYFVGGGSQQGGGQFPINQRGQLTYSGVAYGIDRWKESGTYGTVSIVSNGLQLQETGYGIAGLILDQYSESENAIVGKTVTLSVLINSLSSPYVFQCGGVTYTAHETGLHSFTVNSYAAQGYLARIYNLTASGSATIAAIKLELGTTQTLAHQENGTWVLNEIPNFADELARCQRYFLANVGTISTAYCNEDKAYVKIPTPTTMRANPSASLVATGAVVAPNAQYGVASVSYAEVYNDGVMVVLNTDRSSALGLEMAVYAGGRINLSADL